MSWKFMANTLRVTTRDKRKIRAYEIILSKEISGQVMVFDLMETNLRLQQIKQEISNRYTQSENISKSEFINKIILEMDRKFNNDFISNQEFEWLDRENHRLCYFAWSYIRLFEKHSTSPFSLTYDDISDRITLNILFENIFNNKTISPREYEELKLETRASNTNEIHELIIKYFDCSKESIENKRALLNTLKRTWDDRYRFEKFSWLDKEDHEQCEWMLKYLNKFNMSPWFLPIQTNSFQIYHACIAALDVWDQRDMPLFNDSKEKFIIKMRRAWNQKKHRDNNNDKKAYNIEMHKDIKRKLEIIATHHDKRQNETLETLINNEFNRIKHST